MANFTAKDVNELRKSTGAGLMDCKKALTKADGDTEKAIEFLREKGLATQAKKAGRAAGEGAVIAVTNDDNTVGAVVEVNSETDFVGQNAEFQEFVTKVAKTVIEANPADLDALNAAKIPGEDVTVKEAYDAVFLKFREHLVIKRFKRLEGNIIAYTHAGGKIGTLISMNSSNGVTDALKAAAKDVAFQVTAMNPTYLDETKVPESVKEEETNIALEQINNDPKLSSKPDKVKQNIAKGKLKKFYSEVCLVDQEFVKDSSLTVKAYVADAAKKAGEDFSIADFVRFERGESADK